MRAEGNGPCALPCLTQLGIHAWVGTAETGEVILWKKKKRNPRAWTASKMTRVSWRKLPTSLLKLTCDLNHIWAQPGIPEHVSPELNWWCLANILSYTVARKERKCFILLFRKLQKKVLEFESILNALCYRCGCWRMEFPSECFSLVKSSSLFLMCSTSR